MFLDEPKIIIAVDTSTREAMRQLIAHLDPKLCHLKIGHILFTRYGPGIVEELMQEGFSVFLDLKFFDIPKTIKETCRALIDLNVWMLNFHIQGGRDMLDAVVDTFHQASSRPWLIGVTLLTSMESSDLEWLDTVSVAQMVCRLSSLAYEVGLDGVVCSAQEASLLRQKFGREFLLVTPGIRLPQGKQHDQKRIMSPQAAIHAGAHYLVIGRAITHAQDPLSVLQHIHHQIIH